MTDAGTAAPAHTGAPATAAPRIPSVNASRAAVARASPAFPGGCSATTRAPLSAPPNSAPVSVREDAEPARSTGAAPGARSMIGDITMVTPEASTPQATRVGTSASVSTNHSEQADGDRDDVPGPAVAARRGHPPRDCGYPCRARDDPDAGLVARWIFDPLPGAEGVPPVRAWFWRARAG